MKKILLLSILSLFCGINVPAKHKKVNIQDEPRKLVMFRKLNNCRWHEVKLSKTPWNGNAAAELWLNIQLTKQYGKEGRTFIEFSTFWRDKIEAAEYIITRNTEYGNKGPKQYNLVSYKITCAGLFSNYHLYAEFRDDDSVYKDVPYQMYVDADMMELTD